MAKQKLRLTILLLCVGFLLSFCWIKIWSTEIVATRQHYWGLVLFFILIFLSLFWIKWATVAMGIYLLLATFAFISLTPSIKTFYIRFGSLELIDINILSVSLFILYLLFFSDELINLFYGLKNQNEGK